MKLPALRDSVSRGESYFRAKNIAEQLGLTRSRSGPSAAAGREVRRRRNREVGTRPLDDVARHPKLRRPRIFTVDGGFMEWSQYLMTVRVKRTFEFDAPGERVWEFIADPAKRARPISVVTDWVIIDDHTQTGRSSSQFRWSQTMTVQTRTSNSAARRRPRDRM